MKVDEVKRKIDEGEIEEDIFSCFRKYFEFVNSKSMQPQFLQEKVLVKYVLDQLICFNQKEWRNIHFLREALSNIAWLKERIPLRPDEYYFLYGLNKGKIYQCFGYAIEKMQNNTLYKTKMLTIYRGLHHSSDGLTQLVLSSINVNKKILNAIGNIRSLEELTFSNIAYQSALGFQDGAEDFIACLSTLSQLKSLNLRGNNIGYFSEDELSGLSRVLQGLTSLEQLDLSGNNIHDEGLEYLLAARRVGICKHPTLKKLVLSSNLIELDNGDDPEREHDVGAVVEMMDRTRQNLEYLKGLKKQEVDIDVSTNYITKITKDKEEVEKDRENGENPYFKSSSEVKDLGLYSQTKKVESILNPLFYIDKDNWLITVAKKVGDEHVMIFIEKMTANGQLCLVKYHLKSEKQVTKIKRNQFNPSRFLNERQNYKFWNFYSCEKEKIIRLEESIWSEVDDPPQLDVCKAGVNSIRGFFEQIVRYFTDFAATPENVVTCIGWTMDKVLGAIDPNGIPAKIPSFEMHYTIFETPRRGYNLEPPSAAVMQSKPLAFPIR